MATLKAPFTYFGGKARVAPTVWSRFGDVGAYIECFAGSLAVLLSRPHYPFKAEGRHFETVNDIDCALTNVWRAIQGAPDEVAKYADHPIHECDLIARHRWNNSEGRARASRLKEDPAYFDVEAAGIWLWGISLWIGQGWDITGKSAPAKAKMVGNSSCGVSRKMPHSLNQGINRKSGTRDEDAGILGAAEGSCDERRAWLTSYMKALSDRLRSVRVCCGDWERVLTPSLTFHVAPVVGVFLDPPYCGKDRADVYANESYEVAHKVCKWAIENGDDKRFRIALCGYEGEYAMPSNWAVYRWKAAGGFGNQRKGGEKNENRLRERIWFSPHCLLDEQIPLFSEEQMAEAMEMLPAAEVAAMVVEKPLPASGHSDKPMPLVGKQGGMFDGGGGMRPGPVHELMSAEELEEDGPTADPVTSSEPPPEPAGGERETGGHCGDGGPGKAEAAGAVEAEPAPTPTPAKVPDEEGWF